jgi:hypothetical protein
MAFKPHLGTRDEDGLHLNVINPTNVEERDILGSPSLVPAQAPIIDREIALKAEYNILLSKANEMEAFLNRIIILRKGATP